MKKYLQFAVLVILTLGFSISLQSVLAGWSAPTQDAPGGAYPMAVNIGTSTNSVQSILGSIFIDSSLAVSGASSFSGNVGIGTVSPNRKLEIYSGNGDAIVFGQQGDNTNTIQTYIDGHWADRATYAGGCCNKLLLQPDIGEVGIGTTNPTFKLDVNGTFNAQTSVAVGGTGVITSGGNDVYANIRVLRSQSTAADGMYINYGGTGGTAKIFDGGIINHVDVTSGGNLTFNNVGAGPVGVYDPQKTQAVWAMGPSWTLPIGGGTTNYGNFYGLGWSYEPNYQVAGNNPQSKAGLSHQLLVMIAGTTRTAIGQGIWTVGNISTDGGLYASGEVRACSGGSCSHLRNTGDNNNYLRGNTYFNGILYDEGNTGYYLDPNGTSRLNYGVYDNIYSYGYIQSAGFMYPGRQDDGQAQGTWYLASHPSYGLYSNTGLFLNGDISVPNNTLSSCYWTGDVGNIGGDWPELECNAGYIMAGIDCNGNPWFSGCLTYRIKCCQL